MVKGFWIVQFMGLHGNGGGVVVLNEGKVFGGDSGYTFVGTYKEEGDKLTCLVRVSKFLGSYISVLGVEGDYDLQMVTDTHENEMNGVMSVVGMPDRQLAVKLTKRSDL